MFEWRQHRSRLQVHRGRLTPWLEIGGQIECVGENADGRINLAELRRKLS